MLLSEIHRQIQHANKIVDDFVDFAHQNSAMVNRDLNFFGLGVFGSGEIFQTEPQIIWSVVRGNQNQVRTHERPQPEDSHRSVLPNYNSYINNESHLEEIHSF